MNHDTCSRVGEVWSGDGRARVSLQEKWDSATRRWKDSPGLLESLALLLIDEVSGWRSRRGRATRVEQRPTHTCRHRRQPCGALEASVPFTLSFGCSLIRRLTPTKTQNNVFTNFFKNLMVSTETWMGRVRRLREGTLSVPLFVFAFRTGSYFFPFQSHGLQLGSINISSAAL